MHASVASAQLGQAFDIGALQLGHPAVAKQRLDHGVIGRQPLQHLGSGGIAALAFFLWGRQAQLVKEHLAQLLGAVEVELAHARGSVHGGAAFLNFAAEPGAQLTENALIHQKAHPFHIKQHAGERLLHIPKQSLQAAHLQPLLLPEEQRIHVVGGGRGERRAAVLGAQRQGQGIILLRRMQQISGDHGIMLHHRQGQAVAVQKPP